MNRTILTVAGVLSASSLLLVDSAVKGTVLLALAAVAALILRRDSAATRHLVWLLAIVAMLVVPVLSAMLPQWRVLPTWMSSSRPVVADVSPSSVGKSTGGVIETPRMAEPFEVEQPKATADQRVSALPDSHPALVTPAAVPAPAVRSWNWINALPLAWAIGFSVLMLRLSAARWMLWNSERLATVIRRRVAPQLAFESRSDSATEHDHIVIAMEAICSQLGISRPVTLLIHPHKTIPVVWGILRCRLMLPAEARQWSDEQLRSVLLHELAHIKRRDTVVQLLAQVACALHWFNPLVWFAAWRLDVERERSCDDLVLASGIRPSAYAGHLLDVVTGLSPARWTQACGLAMARKSSLEGRLTAVLGKDRNRRSVSVALAGLALAIAVGVAVPIAMLRAADDKWNPPSGAHVGTNDLTAFCVHDGKDAAFVIAYHGNFGSSSSLVSNPKTRTWTNKGTITAKKLGIALSFHRTHTAPDKLSITTAPAEGRDLSKPAPPPRKFEQKEYDLTKGRVFLLSDSGSVRQLDLATPLVTDREGADKLAKLIAALPPQDREDVALTTNRTGKLVPETIAKLKWGEPVKGLRMALAYPPALGDALLGKKPHFELVVQNVSEKEIHFLASEEAPNPRTMLIREGERIVTGLSDPEVSAADWKLQPGQCGVLRLYTKEEPDKAGTIPSSAIESDLSKIGRYHAIVQMEIAKAPAGAWTGKLVTGPTRGSADKADAPAPKHKDARSLYEVWQRYARANGDIPGGLIGELAGSVKLFIKLNPTWETVPKLKEFIPRLDATRDWKPADAIALLDGLAAVKDSPLSMAVWKGTKHTIRKGEALSKKFAEVPWGKAQPNGLRAAWVLEPSGVEHRIGTALKARLLVQNTGSVPVVLQVPTFHQGGITARNANDEEIEVSGIGWLTLAESVPVRLAPGESIEINTPGVGIGPRAGMGPWAGPRVGSNVLAKPGDELTLTHIPVPLDGSDVGRSEDDPHVVGPGWWLAHIKARLGRELPLPADAAERARLLDRAVRELFAVAPTAEETAAFTADQTPGAFDTLVKRLATRADAVEFSGSLPTPPAKFRVLAADPVADKIPRVVLGPGEYPLSKGTADRGAATLKIVGRSVGDRRTNDAQLLFEATEATGKLPPDPHKLEVPDGWGTWAIVCRPNSGVFYLLSRGAVRKIDYSKPREVTDAPANDLPVEFRDEVKRQLEIAGVSAESQAEVFEKPAPPAKTADVDAVNAVRTAAAPGRYELGDGVQLQVRQVTENGKPTNSAQILFLSPDPKVQPKVPHLEKLPVISSTNRAPTQKAVPGETYDIGFYSPNAAYAFVWQLGANTLWVTEIREGPHIPIWKAPGGTRPGPQTVTVRSFDFSNHADVKLTHVTSSENGGDWSWGKIVPAAFHQPVLDALGERGKRLRDFIEPQKEKPKGAAVKLTPDALLGFWRGTMDGEDLMLSFHRPPVEKEVQLDLYFGRSTIGRMAKFTIASNGDSALVVMEGGDNAALGTLRPIDANAMRLEGTDKEGQAAAIAMLTRDVEPPATEPEDDTRNPRVRKRGDWSKAILAHCKTVAEARGLKEWQPDDVIAWGPDGSGLRSGLVIAPRVAPGGRLTTWLVLRNFSKEPKDVRLVWSWNATDIVAHDASGKALTVRNPELFGVDAIHPVTLKPNEQIEMPGPPVEFGGAKGEGLSCRVETEPGKVLLKFDLTNLPAPETGEVAITVAAADGASAKPAQARPAIEWATVSIEKDGAISLDREKVTLDELKARAAKIAKKSFTIHADKDVPYAKVIDVVETLKAAGVTELGYAKARVGNGKYRVANRQDGYEFDDKHGFSICRPGEYPQYFTVTWPAEGERPKCWLRTYPNVSKQTQGKWAVVWEPGTNVLWWVDDSDVGKMNLTDPAHVIVNYEGRTNNFSRDFGLPEEVKTEFRRLGFVIGRDKTPGLENVIGGNTGGHSIVSAEVGAWSIKGTVTDADGKPLAEVPVRVTTNQVLKTEKTNAKGEYYVSFALPLQLLAHWRGVTVEPILEGFTEREMAKAGEFHVLLRAGEEPQRVRIADGKDFQPGPLPRFADRDLIPSQPGVSSSNAGRADFVMLKAVEVSGEIVTADGKPATPHWIVAATPQQSPGHSAAAQLCDDKGQFRLKGIPTNKPVIFTVNPDLKPGETSKSSEQTFAQTSTHKIRVFLPAKGSGNGPVKIESLTKGVDDP